MGGHDILRSATLARELAYERDRKLERQMQIRLAREHHSTQIGKVTWFGGIKATAQFLVDALHEAAAQRRMTEARG